MMNIVERRENTRYVLPAVAELRNSHQVWAVDILDISSEGARVALHDHASLSAGDTLGLNIELPAEQNPEGISVQLHLNGIVANQSEHLLGIYYQPDNDLDAELLNYIISRLKDFSLPGLRIAQ